MDSPYEAAAALTVKVVTTPIHSGSSDPKIRELSEQYEQVQRDKAVMQLALTKIREDINLCKQLYTGPEARQTRKSIRSDFRRQKRSIEEQIVPLIKDLMTKRIEMDRQLAELHRKKYDGIREIIAQRSTDNQQWSETKKKHHATFQSLLELERKIEIKSYEKTYELQRLFKETRALHRLAQIEKRRQEFIFERYGYIPGSNDKNR